jgi:hypothetical protein
MSTMRLLLRCRRRLRTAGKRMEMLRRCTLL